jgi:hypothetical protein
MDLDHRQYAMEFGVTWACSIVSLVVNVVIALSNEAYSAKMWLEKLKIILSLCIYHHLGLTTKTWVQIN